MLGTTQVVTVPEDPIDPKVLGRVFPRGDDPPIECRGIPREACLRLGTLDESGAGAGMQDVARVVLTCQAARCDDSNGDYRIDAVLHDGSTVNAGAGGYSSTEAAP